ncbi:hypothetical protein HCH_06002 [Hahella chejuensis KCTC 2396]|uniref:Uncharacterized protein n=1 Tax=Hahella chejuensis (strain KCTC 2396) TaxID=349521 RepID=Q2S9M2_HAHCH|nr:hypothetical protein HCH_06002 [Hahella chejuensis KCTC 2396]
MLLEFVPLTFYGHREGKSASISGCNQFVFLLCA